MLNNVGFKATVETPTDVVDRAFYKFDYDALVAGLGITEDAPYAYVQYFSGGDFGPSGLADKDLDAAVLELHVATTDAETKAAMKKIQELWNKLNPAVPLGYQLDQMYWSSKVHGVDPTAARVVRFDRAWLSK